MTAAPTASPRYYCELLPNIRSISVFAVLLSPSDVSTHIIVPPGSRTLFLEHQGKKTALGLPGAGNAGPGPLVITPQPHQKTLSLRIPCAEKAVHAAENIAPWSAKQLAGRPAASINCRNCRAMIVPRDKINKWKDLPHGNWAEAMDFWHCHKPHEKGGENGRYASYGSGFKVVPGTGLIDGVGFLFSGQDVEDAVQNNKMSLTCKGCECVLGRLEHDIGNASELWRIHKWNIQLQNGESECTYPLECFIASEFIGFAEGDGVRRLLITAQDDAKGSRLKVWIFNTDVYYSYPDMDRPDRGIKVYWRLLKPGETAPPTDRLSAASFEAMELDSASFKGLVEVLQRSAELMPREMRVQDEWTAGMLRRFQESDVDVI